MAQRRLQLCFPHLLMNLLKGRPKVWRLQLKGSPKACYHHSRTDLPKADFRCPEPKKVLHLPVVLRRSGLDRGFLEPAQCWAVRLPLPWSRNSIPETPLILRMRGSHWI